MYRYYSRLRPVAPGTFPNNGDVKEIYNYDNRVHIEGVGDVWGWIEYSKPLTDKEVINYELIPAPDEDIPFS